MKRVSCVAVVAIAVSGCATFPASENELLTSGVKREPLCLSESNEVVDSRVKSFLNSCFRLQTMQIGGVSGFDSHFIATESKLQGGKSYNIYKRSAPSGYMVNVKVETGSGACMTKLSGVSFNAGWADKVDRIYASAKGEKTGCGM